MARIVITGAARGLGLALAAAYRERGDVVIAGARSASSAELADLGAHTIAFDALDNDSVTAFGEAAGALGPVDILINNAGIDATALGAPDGERGPLQLSPEHALGEFQVNTIAPMMLTRALAPALAAAHGKVVTMTSQIGSLTVGPTMGRDVGYAMSKAAANMLTVKLAVALKGDGVIAAAMHPGWLQTDMGGPAATLPLAEAVPQIIDSIDALTLDQSGCFIRYDGTVHPW